MMDILYSTKYWCFVAVVAFGAWFGAMPAMAQEWEDDGELDDVEVEIVKDREIKLPFANKNFEKVPPSPVTPTKPELEYTFENVNYKLKTLNPRIRPLKAADDELSKTYGNYIKGGFGNFVTPYLEGFFSNKRNRDYSYGAHFRHLSSRNGPVDDENSGSSDSGIELFGRAFTKTATLGATIGYDTKRYNFYGYEPDQEVNKDTIEQRLNHFHLKADVASNKKKSPLKYNLQASFDFLQDNFSAEESEVGFDFNGSYAFGDAAALNIDADLAFISRDDEGLDIDGRTLFRLSPSFDFEYQDFKIRAGFNVAFENDTITNADKLHFFPAVRASYLLIDDLTIYAGIRGNVEKNTLRSLLAENPFLGAAVPVFHSNKTFDFYGGLEGKLSNAIGVHGGVSVANYKNMYFYVNSLENRAEFDIIYDTGNTTVFNAFAELMLNKSDKLKAVGRVDYYGYGTDEVAEAWHKPNYRVSVLAGYTLVEKIVLNGGLYVIGGIEAPTLDGNVELDPAIDLNLKMEYLFSDAASAFIKVDNIFSNEYELLNNYPVRGLQAMVGFTYNF